MCTTAFFHNKDKTIRDDRLDFDSMHSSEKEEVMFKLKKQLEQYSELPIDSDEYVVDVPKVPSTVQT